MEDYCRAVGDGELVVSSRDTAPYGRNCLIQREGALDDVAFFVGNFIEGWWTSAVSPFALSGGDLIALLGDHCLDSAYAEHAPIRPTVVGRLVAQDSVGSRAWSSAADPGRADVVQDMLEHRPVVALDTSDHNLQRQSADIDGKKNLRCQPAAGAPMP